MRVVLLADNSAGEGLLSALDAGGRAPDPIADDLALWIRIGRGPGVGVGAETPAS